ncbi:unnamed protein product [Prunus brigantina]
MAQCKEACLLMGDFNDITDVTEKRGGLPRTERSLHDFSMFAVNSHLLDLGYVGHPFTWRNRRQEGGIMERLDRGFGNDQWVTLDFGLEKRRSEWRSSKATIALLQQQLKATYLAPDFDRDEVLQLESSLKGALREEDIISTCSPSNIESITDCVQPRVTMQQNACLTWQISSEEIWLAVKSLNPTKSPGPDGFTGKFFHQYWDVIGEDISGMIATPRKMTQWRPIALCNLVYKIISKILIARLKALLPKIISLNQSAFIEDRLITDNILIVHEILHSLKKEGELGRSSLALKLDSAKAYDRVEWPFVEQMMRRLGIDCLLELGNGVRVYCNI